MEVRPTRRCQGRSPQPKQRSRPPRHAAQRQRCARWRVQSAAVGLVADRMDARSHGRSVQHHVHPGQRPEGCGRHEGLETPGSRASPAAPTQTTHPESYFGGK